MIEGTRPPYVVNFEGVGTMVGKIAVALNNAVRSLRNSNPDDPVTQKLADTISRTGRQIIREAAFGSASSVANDFWQGRVDVNHT